MEYYSAIKRNEIGSFVEMWMDLETLRTGGQQLSTSVSSQPSCWCPLNLVFLVAMPEPLPCCHVTKPLLYILL